MDSSSSTHTSLSALRESYHHIFSSGISFSKLKDQALKDRLFPKDAAEPGDHHESQGFSGRSIAWKLFLGKHEPLQAASPPRATALLEELRVSRERFTQLLVDWTKPPDERLAERMKSSSGGLDTARNVNTNNPLSLHTENPWNEWFSGLELKATISQDVERTFPEIAFFRGADVQSQLTNILFIYASTHTQIGYRQGMHEILAPLYYAVYYDSTGRDAAIEPELQEITSNDWIAADAWALFSIVMAGVSPWYEWREPNPRVTQTGLGSATEGRSGISGHVHLIAPSSGPQGLQPWVAPIVKACNYIQSDLLKKVDPILWSALQKGGIEPQLYGIRWLRMLFSREFTMEDTMKLWDGLFAYDPKLELAQWVCVAMLIRIRTKLINGDYSTQLTTLLRYPALPNKLVLDDTPAHTSLLLQQALSLQTSPIPSTAATIAMQNRTLLGIPLEPPEHSPVSSPSPRHAPLNRTTNNGAKEKPGHARQLSSPTSLAEMLPRGFLERGESYGINVNRTLLSAVSELKRNIPDISALVKSTTPDTFQLEDERPSPPPTTSSTKQSWAPRPQTSSASAEREPAAKLKSRDKKLGDALGWIVDVLLQDEESVVDMERLKRRRREAVESLSYIRDVLISGAEVLEEERLVSEGTVVSANKRKAVGQPAGTTPPKSPSPPPPPPPPMIVAAPTAPQPASIVDRDAGSRTSHDRKIVRVPPPMFSPNQSIIHSVSDAVEFAPKNRAAAPANRPQTFSRPSMVGTTLPRKPPPTSSGGLRPTERSRDVRKVYEDPLGAMGFQ